MSKIRPGEDLDLMELGGQIAWVEPELMERVVGGEIHRWCVQ